MIAYANILADSDDNVINFVIMLVVGLVSLVGSLASAAKKRREKQMEEQRLRSLVSRTPDSADSAEAVESLAQQAGEDQQEGRVVWEAQSTPPALPAAMEESGNSQFHQPPLFSRSQQSPPPQQARRQYMVPRRTHLSTAAPMEHDESPHLDHLSAIEQAHVSRRHVVAVDMSSQATALRAIIYQEILSQPKALRTSPEIWDV